MSAYLTVCNTSRFCNNFSMPSIRVLLLSVASSYNDNQIIQVFLVEHDNPGNLFEELTTCDRLAYWK